MVKKDEVADSLFTLPVVVGVLVVLGGVAALGVSSLFVYRAHAVKAEAERMRAWMTAEQQRQARQLAPLADKRIISQSVPPQLQGRLTGMTGLSPEDILVADEKLKPGVRLRAARRIYWEEAEIVDVLEDERIKVRWLSGEPGEDVIASHLVYSDDIPTP